MRKALFMALLLCGGARADMIDDLLPGHWLEIPNSQMAQVYYTGPLATEIKAVSGPKAVMDGWSGAALDTLRNRLVLFGGGHTNYAGDELYAFDLMTLTWALIADPHSVAAYPTTCSPPAGSGVLADGAPVSRHTYGGMAYLPVSDSLLTAGGSAWPCGEIRKETWRFDFGGGWVQLPPVPWANYGNLMAYDAATGHVWYEAAGSHGFLSEFDPATISWTARGDQYMTAITNKMSAAIHPGTHQLVAVGNNSGDVLTWDLNASGKIPFVRHATTGAYPTCFNPGFAWDGDAGLFLAWCGGSSLFTLEIGTWTWGVQVPAADNTVVPTAANSNGTFGRFQYVPARGVFVLVNRTTDDVFIYKPDFSGSAPGGASNACTAPTLGTLAPLSVPVNGKASYQLTAGAAVYSAKGLPDGLTIDQGSGAISGSPTTLGDYSVAVTAANNCGQASGTLAVAITGHYHFHVGGQDYPNLQAALDAAPAGATVTIDPGIYVNMYGKNARAVTLQGHAGDTELHNDQPIPNGKGILIANASLTVDGLTFSGAQVADHNGAGIRYQAGNLTVLNSDFHDNENGIMSGAFDGAAVVKNSTFERNGYGDGFSHGVYFGHITKVAISYSTFTDTKAGHHIKSRALQTRIDHVITDDGTVPVGASYEIDTPSGGTVEITCTKMTRNANWQNNQMVSFGEEGKTLSAGPHALTITRSLFINNSGRQIVAVRNGIAVTAILADNTLVNIVKPNVGTFTDVLTTAANDPGASLPCECGVIGAN